MVAPALTGDECNSSWIDSGICRTELNFIINTLSNGRMFPSRFPAKGRFVCVTDMLKARMPTQTDLEKLEDLASRNPMEFSKVKYKLVCLGWNKLFTC